MGKDEIVPNAVGDKETIFEKASCTLLTRFSSTLFDRKTEIRKYSVETAQPSARARPTAHSPGLDR